jgi:hypothetical protein
MHYHGQPRVVFFNLLIWGGGHFYQAPSPHFLDVYFVSPKGSFLEFFIIPEILSALKSQEVFYGCLVYRSQFTPW